MRGSRKFDERGPTQATFFCLFVILVAEGRGDQNTTKSGPLSADDGSPLNAGMVAL